MEDIKLAKVNDYKQMKIFIEKDDNSTIMCDDLFDGFESFWKCKDAKALVANFELKRRQSIDTWCNQISKAAYARLMYINKARKNAGLEAFTDETLAEALVFEPTCDGNNVMLKIFKKVE